MVVLTTYADDDSILDALQAGALGYLTKDAGRRRSAGRAAPARPARRCSTRRCSCALVEALVRAPAAGPAGRRRLPTT